MKIKQGLVLLLIASPMISFADITAVNHTNIYATAHVKHSCSSAAGTRGILQPYQTDYSVPQAIIDSFCLLSTCTAHVYASQNCTGNKIAIVEVDRKGIISLTNLDKEHYQITWNSKHVTLDRVQK